ncbi:MAG TPA: NAD-dependent epimerase/dehydratase family protein [Bacteroidales bacterium]|nr:NAD-dependent epimerase/dehydratase family protein [Bacteroidales bacterium]
MAQTRYCITGGSGFIGTRLIESLHESGAQIRNIDKNQSSRFPEMTVIQDIRDREGLVGNMIPADIVVHLAAEHKDNVTPTSLYYDVNVAGTKNLLMGMEGSGIHKIIFTSTVAIYGLDKDYPDENRPPDPFNHYGKSKLEAEALIREWQSGDPGRSAVILRPSVVFGEGNRGNVYNLLKQISSGRFMMIGKGENTKSMAYVGNVSAFIRFLAETMRPGLHVYNYTDLPDITTREIVSVVRAELGKSRSVIRLPYSIGMAAGKLFDIFSAVTGKEMNISAIRIKKFCSSTRFDSTKAHSLGFDPPYRLVDALRKTIQAEFRNE